MADPDDRLLGGLTITILRVTDLFKVSSFGIMDPYVVVGLNQEKQHTRCVEDGGRSCEFNETLHLNTDCQKQDLLHIKVKHKTRFSSTTIGVFSLQMANFIKHQKKKLRFQLVDEETFEDRGTIELIQEYHGTNEKLMYESDAAYEAASAAAASTPYPVEPVVVPSLHVAPSVDHTPSPIESPAPVDRSNMPSASEPVSAPAVFAPYVAPAMTMAPSVVTAPPVVSSAYVAPVGEWQPPAPTMQAAPTWSGQIASPVMQQQAAYGSGPPQQPYSSGQSYGSQQYGAGGQFQPPPVAPYQSQQLQTPPYAPPQGSYTQSSPAFSSSSSSQQQQQPYGSQQQQYGSNQYGSQQQAPVAPFQTFAVGRPHQDSRMFDDTAYLAQRTSQAFICELRIFSTYNVTALQLVYLINGARVEGPIAGATFSQPHVWSINVSGGERIEQVRGRTGANGIESLHIETNKQSAHFGTSTTGQEFQLNVPRGHRVIGFHGSFTSANGLTSIGAFTVQ